MSSHERLPEELSSFERALSGLAPAPSRIDRDRLMYELGVQAATEQLAAADLRRPRRWFVAEHTWAAAAVVLACTSLGLAVRLAAEVRGVADESLALQSTDSAPAPLATPKSDDEADSGGESRERNTSPSRRTAEEQWLAVASSTSRGNSVLRLRPQPLTGRNNASVPLVVAEATPDRMPFASDAAQPSNVHPVPDRLNNREQWQNWLDSIN